MGSLELRKIAVARAAGSQVIEPLLRFGEWHFMRGDSLENVRARAPGAVRVRKLFEQTTAQRIQDAHFVSLRISLYVQTCLPLQTLSRFTKKIHPVALIQSSSAFQPSAVERCSVESSPHRSQTSFSLDLPWCPTTRKFLSTNSPIGVPARSFLSGGP